MKINWHENPLKTSIFLDDAEKKIFAERAKIIELRQAAMTAIVHLKDKEKKLYNPERALAFLKAALDEEGVSERCGEMLDALETGFHCGDCTCIATSCEKCLAENVLGVWTLDGLTQYGGYKIDIIFGREEGATIDQALIQLDGEIAEALQDGRQEDHDELAGVRDWLVRYRAVNLVESGSVTQKDLMREA